MAEAIDVFDVAGEEGVGVGVFAGVDGLGEVDHDGLVFPVENVEGGEVAVDAVVGEAELDVVEHAVVDVGGLVRGGAEGAELGGGGGVVADVLHEDGGFADGDGTGGVSANVVEMIEGFPFVVDPGAHLDLAAHFGFVGQGAAGAAGEDDFALAIELVVAKAAVLEGLVDFGGDEAAADGGVGAAAADGGFFATLEDLEDVGDQIAIKKILKRRRDEFVLKHWGLREEPTEGEHKVRPYRRRRGRGMPRPYEEGRK